MNTIINWIKDNQKTLIKVGAVVGGSLVGLLAVSLVGEKAISNGIEAGVIPVDPDDLVRDDDADETTEG